MAKNKLIFLGTGTSQGIPVIGSNDPVSLSKDSKDKRTRTSAIVQYNSKDLLIDCGPDFRQQMLREKLINVDAVLLTHEHTDHVGGLDDLRPINFLKQNNIPLYGDTRTLDDIKRRFSYAFKKYKYPGVPGFDLHYINNSTSDFIAEGITITPINILHGELPVLGYRIGNLAYITDASFIADEEIEKIKNVEILVVNALRYEKHISHFSVPEAISLAEKVQAKQTYFIHISFHLGFHQKVQSQLPKNIYLAYDGLSVEFS